MTDHTPTPWELFDHNGVVAIVNPRAKSSKREIVFWSGFDASHYPRQAAANAAFIVKAVNNHEALVKALRESAADIVGSCKNPDDPYIAEALRRIGNVLAAVGGGS